MNRLLQAAPDALEAAGARYKINPGYRAVLQVLAAFKDKELAEEDKVDILLYNLFLDLQKTPVASVAYLPQAFKMELAQKAHWFLKCGDDKEKALGEKPVLDFQQDAQHIYNAFLKKGINLDYEDLHWWHFMGHFSELPECFLTRLMYLRGQNNRGKLTKEEKQECSRIGWDIVLINSNLDLLEAEPEWLF